MTTQTKPISKLTHHAKNSIIRAEKIARTDCARVVHPAHLLYGVFLERGSVGATILRNIGLTKDLFEKIIFSPESTKRKSAKNIASSKALKKMIVDAHALAAEFSYTYVGTEHLAYVLLGSTDKTIQKIMRHAKITDADKMPTRNSDDGAPQSGLFGIENLSSLMGGKDTATETTIDQFCTYIAQQEQEPFYGRKDDIDRITTILGRRTKNNPLLIGEPGIGKTAIIEHIAHIAHSPDAPHYLYNKDIVTLDLPMLVAGTSFRGEFEQRLKNIITEAQDNPNIILFIDEIHTIIGTGNTGGSLDAANILKPALARGNVRIIGATTLSEYKKYIEKDAALERRFQKVLLTEPTATQTKHIVSGVKNTLESYHGVTFDKDALHATVHFCERYMPEKNFPDKALDVLDETAARLCAQSDHKNDTHHTIAVLENDLEDIVAQKAMYVQEKRYEEASQLRELEYALTQEILFRQNEANRTHKKHRIPITVDDIAHTVAQNTGIPHEKIMQKPHTHILNAQKNLTKKIVGQKDAVEKIAHTLIRSASGISNPNRPHGSFLFLGPTGVGKTFTAQTLAQEMYDKTDSLIRVDMSELMERHHTSKLLGAPAGYVGYGEGGTLTEKVRNNPHSVLLFDEIEKAHPDVHNILLQILEDGTLTDATGRVINFKNTIVILTSNIGTEHASEPKNLGFQKTTTQKHLDKKIQKSARDILAPELLARLDHVIVFNTLCEKDFKTITRKELHAIRTRMKAQKINLFFTNNLINHIAHVAHKQKHGARGIRHYIQNDVETAIAHFILEHPQQHNITIDYHDDTIVCTKK